MTELIAEGRTKVGSVPAGGAAAPSSAAGQEIFYYAIRWSLPRNQWWYGFSLIFCLAFDKFLILPVL